VLEAFEQLYADGYVEGRSGSGTYVVRELRSDVLRASPDRAPGASPAAPGRLLSRRGAILAATPMPIPTVTRPRAFVPGIPGLEDFPFELWRRLMAKQWRRAPVDRMLYGDPAGYQPLREAIAAYLGEARAAWMPRRQTSSWSDVATGARPGGAAARRRRRCRLDGDPGYPGVRAELHRAARAIPVPVDDEGPT
jgi:GntR family transcriptional regulator/MocR family aminotransferase